MKKMRLNKDDIYVVIKNSTQGTIGDPREEQTRINFNIIYGNKKIGNISYITQRGGDIPGFDWFDIDAETASFILLLDNIERKNKMPIIGCLILDDIEIKEKYRGSKIAIDCIASSLDMINMLYHEGYYLFANVFPMQYSRYLVEGIEDQIDLKQFNKDRDSLVSYYKKLGFVDTKKNYDNNEYSGRMMYAETYDIANKSKYDEE